ncbi:leucine-rich repeat serine/threonine-protein kinase 1 isoform X2 [Corythoichthys intestinalis]|uniref:leucine-rich repeat serine/threonine-protein kinase 1 isoform X2 n=1 Tax=Corythoichthys intestinalis TaxID=161448 RepID=UPI0025A6644C|nr:leucine-rich repeat serine/threonine-protein kinase 1 isoform X2 [Corythoichthys intestinalis]
MLIQQRQNEHNWTFINDFRALFDLTAFRRNKSILSRCFSRPCRHPASVRGGPAGDGPGLDQAGRRGTGQERPGRRRSAFGVTARRRAERRLPPARSPNPGPDGRVGAEPGSGGGLHRTWRRAQNSAGFHSGRTSERRAPELPVSDFLSARSRGLCASSGRGLWRRRRRTRWRPERPLPRHRRPADLRRGASGEEVADFLLEKGAALSSYALMDHPDFSARLLARRLQRDTREGQEEVSVRWGGLSLPWLELSWLMGVSAIIAHLDLSRNNLSSLPSVLPWGLLHLRTVDLSGNRLSLLPSPATSREVICTSLREVNVRENLLTTLPTGLLHLTQLEKLCASKNRMTSLFDIPPPANWRGLRKLEDLDISDNHLSQLPVDVVPALRSLRVLDVSRNRLDSFPEPWACPLKWCRASSNKLSSLPDNFSTFWKTHLQDADFSDNLLEGLPADLFRLEALLWLKLRGNSIGTLPPPSEWTCSQLRTLDLSSNMLGKSQEGPKSSKLSFLSTWSKKDPDAATAAACPVEFPAFLRDSLEVLYLNDNRLERVPPSVCALSGLSELYLANNPGIRELPVELGGLSNLWQLDTENLNISNIPQRVQKEGAASVLGFLRAQLRRSEPWRQLKMLLIGPPRQGKTSLLGALRTGKAATSFPATACGISTSTLETDAGEKDQSSLALDVWDVGGPSGASAAAAQCFYTDGALYVLVWNLTLGEEAAAGLRAWLLNIEARAPNSAVLVVGTHLDLLDVKFRTERLATLRAHVLALCRSPSGARAGGYPDVTFAHLREVSCKTSEGVDDLKALIRQAALSIKDARSPAYGGKLLGRLIPRSYVRLREAVAAERRRRHADGEVQFLSQEQLERLAKQDPEGDIAEYDDLPSAVKFLTETGTLLHFPDSSRGLRTLYFLCPVWLADSLRAIVRPESSRSNGIVRAGDLRILLVGTGLTRDSEEQFFQFLAKFEIALPVADDSYLLPHLLPAKPGVDLHCLRRPGADTLRRLFKMSFVPAGFWERFIARMLISLNDMDQLSSELQRSARPRQGRMSAIYSLGGNQRRNRCSTFRVRRRQTVYWREGLLVTFDGGYFSVESAEVNWKKKSGGIEIVCQSESGDFSAVAFVTDHINNLVEQWFPALTASESDGTPLLEQYAPCQRCAARIPRNGTSRSGRDSEGEGLHLFGVEDCALAALAGDFIECPGPPGHIVPLRELVPELFMTDFPARLFLEKDYLEYSEDESNIIGQGGSGTIVYRARYRGQPVAIKRFHSRNFWQRAPSEDADTMIKRLRSAEVCHRFAEFRQEATTLRRLRHPCVVALEGVSVRPLCLVLELAPLGSLRDVLEGSLDGGRGISYVPLGHMITYKMAYQVATGLTYLHRKNIIFCDLKSDNILVWSLQERDAVNVKLSDYGVCRQSFREGALGVEGTPGYQAPEVRPGVVYDEKVDVFSYGMVLYELLSGRRPSLGRHPLHVSKKLAGGARPTLASPQEVNFHFLQRLMTQCWHGKPEQRPTASQCARRMMDPGFACLRYVLPCGARGRLFLPSLGGRRHVVFWDGDGDDRSYSVVNVQKGELEVNRKSCPGGRVSCLVKMADTLWLATYEQEVQVYLLKDMCPLTRPHKRFPCPAVITCFLKIPDGGQQAEGVFAGMSDGALVRYGAAEDGLPSGDVAYACPQSSTIEEPGRRPAPVTCMLLIGCGSQLWVSDGPGVLVLERHGLSPMRRLKPYEFPSLLVSMAMGFSVWGEESVWTLDDVTDTLVLFHAASFAPCAKYSCGDCSPFRDVFPVSRPSTVGINGEEAGIRTVSPRVSPGGGSTDSDDGEDRDTTESPAPPLRAFKVLMVNDLLWVFRRGGDVLLIQVEPDGDRMRGRVGAVLEPPSIESLGTLEEVGLAGDDAVVCGFGGASSISLCVWRAWDSPRLEVFYRSAEDPARLEMGLRRCR